MAIYEVGTKTGYDSEVEVNGVIYKVATPRNSGTGGYNTFLAIQDNDGTEQGFNTDGTPTTENQIGDSKTSAIKLSAMPIYTDPGTGTQYFEIRLDLNESNGGVSPNVDLNALKIYTGAGGVTTIGGLNALNLQYDLDAGGDNTIHMWDGSSGSGTDDYVILIPVSLFDDANFATDYFYLYAEFGTVPSIYQAEGGFEEFNLQTAVVLNGIKFNDYNNNTINDDGVNSTVNVGGITMNLYEDTNGNGVLDAGDAIIRTTTTAADGSYSFYGVAPGATYFVDEESSASYTQTTGSYETVVVSDKAVAGSTITIDPIGNHFPVPHVSIDKEFVNVTDGPDTGSSTTVIDGSGDTANFTIAVTNDGETALTNVTVTDSLSDSGAVAVLKTGGFNQGDSDSDGVLDIGETWYYTATRTATQGDLDTNGGGDSDLDNSATVVATQQGTSNTVTDTDDAAAPLAYNPAIDVTKSVTSITGGADYGGTIKADSAGDVINYAIAIQNTGNISLTGVTVTDAVESYGATNATYASGDTDTDGVLDVGETWNYTASYTVTQADLDGKGGGDFDIDNLATGDTNETEADTATATAPLAYNPAIDVTKSVTSITGGADYGGTIKADSAGDVINYAIAIENTGNISLTGVTVTDAVESYGATNATYASGDTDTDGVLDVGETWNYTASYTVTQADLDGKGGGDFDIDNLATGDTNETEADTATATAPLAYNPAIDVTKSVTSITGGADYGGTIKADSAGDVINYAIAIQNTGNISLTGVTVTDAVESYGATNATYASGDTDTDGVLDVGETWNYTASYTVTQADLDGKGGGDFDIDNLATGDTNETEADTATATAPLAYNPAIDVTKSVTSITGGADYGGTIKADSAGDVINYAIAIQNTGNISLTGVTVTDAVESYGATNATYASGDTDTDGVLDVGETWNYTASYTVTQADLDGKGGGDFDIDNLATGDTNETEADTATATAPLAYNPAIDVTKSVTSITGGADYGGTIKADSAGDVINYAIAIQNTGNISLTGVTVTDAVESYGATNATYASGDTDTDGVLDVGETWNYTASYTVTQADLDGKGGGDFDIDNLATGDTNETEADTATATAPLAYNPAFTVEKAVSFDGVTFDDADNPDGPLASVLQTPTFLVTIANTGNITLTGFSIADLNYTFDASGTAVDLSGAVLSGDTDSDGELDVGETWQLQYTQPLDIGYHKNTVTVDFNETGPQSDDAYYYVLANEGPGVRTPGFWQNPNNGGTFWDGIADNQAHQGDTFPDGDPNVDGNQDLIYLVDTDCDGSLADESINLANQKSFGLLIGDYNKNGITDNYGMDGIAGTADDVQEDTIFISYKDAMSLINASSKQGNDVTYTIGRDVVATWLNYLAGNNIDPLTSNPDEIANAPRHYIDDAIDWMQEFASNKMDADVDCATFAFKSYKSNSDAWKKGVPDDGDSHSGSDIHSALGGYNENGHIAGFEYAGDGDSSVYGFALNQVLSTNLYDTGPLDQQDPSMLMVSNSLVAV